MSTTALLLTAVTLFGLGLAVVSPILFKLYRRCRIEEITPEWLEGFSPSSYYPMERLLSEEDFRFLSRQPGFDLSLYRKLRKDRLHIFRQYLSHLIRDFNRLHTAARLLLAQAEEDRSDVVARLIWLKVRFSWAVIRAEFSYLLCCVGFRTLAVRAAILSLEEMSTQLGSIASAHAA